MERIGSDDTIYDCNVVDTTIKMAYKKITE